jgi:hypothetical protein
MSRSTLESRAPFDPRHPYPAGLLIDLAPPINSDWSESVSCQNASKPELYSMRTMKAVLVIAGKDGMCSRVGTMTGFVYSRYSV